MSKPALTFLRFGALSAMVLGSWAAGYFVHWTLGVAIFACFWLFGAIKWDDEA